ASKSSTILQTKSSGSTIKFLKSLSIQKQMTS
ncbi:MAG: hypothetical protein ACI86H_002063, partial [bacterium]